ncbi:MAG TPA: hypothetical protein VFU19_16480 [Iamia sp.]|nr:hypothetical protein [Iamia sp.]
MRRGCRCLLSLILAIGALAACGDDGGSSSAPTTTTTASTTTGPTTTGLDDPGAAVDEFCAKAEEIESFARNTPQPTTPQQGQEWQGLLNEVLQMMQVLQSQTAAMVPGDVTRFQECSSMFNIQQE